MLHSRVVIISLLTGVTGSVLLVVIERFLSNSVGGVLTSFLFIIAVLIAAILGGWKSGITTTAAMMLTAVFCFSPPYYVRIGSNPTELFRFGSFGFIGLILSGIGEQLLLRRKAIDERQERLDLEAAERRKAESAERGLAQELITTLSSIGDGVISSGCDGRVRFVNPVAEELTGWTTAEAIGRLISDVFQIIDEVTRQAIPNAGVQALETGLIVRPENHPVLVARGGVEYLVEESAAPIRGENERISGVVLVFRDLTERRKQQEALRRHELEENRKKDDFIALLAHELRNPLAPIQNGLTLLFMGPDHQQREQIQEMMRRQLTHIVRLIDDLMDVSRINRGKIELRPSQILLSDVISSAVEAARPAIEAADHRLIIEIPAASVFVKGDLTRLSQVFSNLLVNSAKYTPPKGEIKLIATTDESSVKVSISDNGIGITNVLLPHIFEMFSQGDRSIERSTGGLGIGLALAKALVEMHDGTISATSEGTGHGTTITVRLPMAAAEPGKSLIGSTPENLGPISACRRILIVDDNRDSAESLAMILDEMGNAVDVASDGIEAIEQARAIRPQVILMDLGIPKLNSIEATRRIRQQAWGKEMIIIALTGWGQERDRQQSRDAGCNGHLVKPVQVTDLLQMLNSLTQSEAALN